MCDTPLSDVRLSFKGVSSFSINYKNIGFGKENPVSMYEIKYETLYKEGLTAKLKPELNGYENFMKNYQLMRNISYVDTTTENVLIIIFPEGNRKIRKEYDHLMEHVIKANSHPNIRLMSWENLCSDFVNVLHSSSNTSDRLLA